MSNFLVCIMLVGIMRATNQEFVAERLDSLLSVIGIAFFVDLLRFGYYLFRKGTDK